MLYWSVKWHVLDKSIYFHWSEKIKNNTIEKNMSIVWEATGKKSLTLFVGICHKLPAYYVFFEPQKPVTRNQDEAGILGWSPGASCQQGEWTRDTGRDSEKNVTHCSLLPPSTDDFSTASNCERPERETELEPEKR